MYDVQPKAVDKIWSNWEK